MRCWRVLPPQRHPTAHGEGPPRTGRPMKTLFAVWVWYVSPGYTSHSTAPEQSGPEWTSATLSALLATTSGLESIGKQPLGS